jgi:hypothetical protein
MRDRSPDPVYFTDAAGVRNRVLDGVMRAGGGFGGLRPSGW